MKVLGIKCTKGGLGWVVLEGTSRRDAAVIVYDQATAPLKTERAETLAWGRKEILEIVERHHPDIAALRATEGQNGSFERAEMDGVVQAALHELDIPVSRMKAVTIRSKYKARNNEALESAISELPALTKKTTKAQRDLLVVAAAAVPE
jgi:Holliday junction resolvasome RuvABC endonuclease subunit